MRSIIAGATIWILLAGAAVVGVFSVLSGIGSGKSDNQPHPLSRSEIARELASPTETPDDIHKATPRPSAENSSPAPPKRGSAKSAPAEEKSSNPHPKHRLAKQTDGGTVVASCTNGAAHLDSWSPAPGFDSDDVHRGPATVASIEFEGDDMPDYLVTVRCRGGKPAISSVIVDD